MLAHATGSYCPNVVGQMFGLHYATVSRLVWAVETVFENSERGML